MADLVIGDEPQQVTTAKKRAIILCALIAVMTVGGLVATGGHPRSNWLYPFALLLAVAACAWSYHIGDRPSSLDGDNPPKPVADALTAAAISFVLFSAVLYGFSSLIHPTPSTVLLSIFFGATAGANAYRKKRGYEYSVWPTMIILGGFILFESLKLMVN